LQPITLEFVYGKLRNTIFFRRGGVSAVESYPRSLILVPIESAYAISY